MKEISVSEYLEGKDLCALKTDDLPAPLRIDLSPPIADEQMVVRAHDIGRGCKILLGHLAGSIKRDKNGWVTKLFEYIKNHKIAGQAVLFTEDRFTTVERFQRGLEKLMRSLENLPSATPLTEVKGMMKKHGFGAGWGDRLAIILKNMRLIQRVFARPNAADLEKLFLQFPFISRIAIISPHGWFGQENVLGKPDTGGQVIYILDQVRGLEKEMKKQFVRCGIENHIKIIVLSRLIPNAGNTTCDHRLEKIHGAENSWILRVPFRTGGGEMVRDWCSRFQVWPYLDRFAGESEKALVEEFPGKPDLIIGNYSDGNIVAALLSKAMGSTLCTIAHALEKTKYINSDLFWRDFEEQYHFSLHFTSDLLAMKRSDFIITSTYQEIAGTKESMGQYESYQAFTLPGHYRVDWGTDIRSPKYNVNPPGVDECYYFPYFELGKRDGNRKACWERRLFADDDGDILGKLDDPDKPPLFSMARLDKIKNLSGLVQAYGNNDELMGLANLIIAGGTTSFDESEDEEERHEIKKISDLVNRYNLNGKLRWLPSINKSETGEVYRIMADRRGVFIQPALFEGFGLTVLEAMLSGLPSFATMFGGPSQIIEDGINGFLINPHVQKFFTDIIQSFLDEVNRKPDYWNRISEAGVRRVQEYFTWPLYSERLIGMANLYSFWKHAAPEQITMLDKRYWDILYYFLLKKPAESIS
jgi:sucrose synthase